MVLVMVLTEPAGSTGRFGAGAEPAGSGAGTAFSSNTGIYSGLAFLRMVLVLVQVTAMVPVMVLVSAHIRLPTPSQIL